MKKLLFILFSLFFIAGIFISGCTNANPAGANGTATPINIIVTATPSATPIPTIVANFEGFTAGPMPTPAGGLWWKTATQSVPLSQYCSITLTVKTGTGGYGLNSLEVVADIVGDNYPNVSWGTALDAGWPVVDLNTMTSNGYTGLRLRVKLVSGTGSPVVYNLQLNDPRVVDGSYWRYIINDRLVDGAWTTLSVPFSYFTISGWGGAADSYTRADTYAHFNGVMWSILANNNGNACYGAHLYIDDVEIY